MFNRRLVLAAGALAIIAAPPLTVVAWQQAPSLGFQDTPLLPGGKWHVHDGMRPQPPVVAPGTAGTPDAPGKPPGDAVVLFNGSGQESFRTGDGQDAGWTIRDGALVVKSGAGMIYSRAKFGDSQIHLEYRTPTPARGDGQGRGNTGIWIMGRYEVQILDNYNNPTYADGTVGAIYGQTPPLVNASRPPGEWQTLDVVFTAPRFKEDHSVATPAYLTVFVNGLLTQDHTASQGPVVWKKLAHYEYHDSTEPLALQDHGNPVEFRNIWVRPIRSIEQP